MPGFDIGLDIDAELAGISKKQNQSEPRQPKKPISAERVKAVPETQSEHSQVKPGVGQTLTESQAMPGGGTESQIPTHSHGGEDASSSEAPAKKKGAAPPIDWKRFKTMTGIFEHVGGDRPVRLNPEIKPSQVSGLPEPMLGAVQKRLKENHMGAVVSFPWGEFEITEKNRVFTQKSSLIRYLLFDAFRDDAGTHIQYAKQWLVLQHPVFDKGFNPDTHLKPTSDELDIYALLFVAHTAEAFNDETSGSSPSRSEQDYQTAERLGMLNLGVGRVLDKLNEQEKLFRAYAERHAVMQTVILLDRMGLLVGGLPRDVGEFVRVLEENRDILAETDATVSGHIDAEKERQKRLVRQERLRKMQQREFR
jgi:hypothetical protein